MKSRERIIAAVATVLCLEPGEVADGQTLAQLGADSLDVCELASVLDFELPTKKPTPLLGLTVGELVEMIGA